jgi:hypothetical protein
VAIWSAVFNAGNASLEVSRRALELLGCRARLIDLGYRSNNALLPAGMSAGLAELALVALEMVTSSS